MEQELEFNSEDILGRFAQQISGEDGFISVKGIKNKDITRQYRLIIRDIILYLVMTPILFVCGEILDGLELGDFYSFLAFLIDMAGLVCLWLFVVYVMGFIKYHRNSVPVSEQIRDLINENIAEGYGSFCYKNAGLFFLREWIVGTQRELDVINYNEVASYGAIGKDLWIYATNSDFHLFKFMSDAECSDAYKFMQSKILTPSVDYEDPVLKGNPRDMFKTRTYPFEPVALKRINCANISDWFGRKLIVLLTSAVGVVASWVLLTKVPFFTGENSLPRQLLVIAMFIMVIMVIVEFLRIRKIRKKAEMIDEEALEEIEKSIHLPTVYFASDYNTYVFDNVILHYGRSLDVMKVEDIKIISHGADEKGSYLSNNPGGKRSWYTPFLTIATNDTVCNIKSKLSIRGRVPGLNLSDTAKELVIYIKSLPAYLKSPSATADGSTRKLKNQGSNSSANRSTSNAATNKAKKNNKKTPRANSQKKKKR
ncbi:hypothetical protein [Butyrivibrio proteoclasticus]|uniref:hypothetical protein n=1 Tax=Butyrivibrio proteoclasticus TaxID=43305 RepID=UPI00047C014D|nr:hypothetical protein [Butyrivibrio proteoclasticus]